MIDKPDLIEFLKKHHLFLGLSDSELDLLADELQQQAFTAGGKAFIEGAEADSLHIILQGRVDITRTLNKKIVKVASLTKGDYYGEEGLLRSQKRLVNATVETGTILLLLSRKSLVRLLKNGSSLRANLKSMLASRRLARELQFSWVGENEVINFLSRKHVFVLIRDMVLPVLFLFPVVACIALAYILNSSTLGLIGGFLFICNLAWGAWCVIDWGNDYYIVTNQRVIWLEKVIGFYDSRTEAGMSMILSVDSESDFPGRLFNYGSVIVRTYTGQIRMAFVNNPRQAAAMIEGYLNRAKEVGRKMSEESMKQAIIARLGLGKPELDQDAGTSKPAPASPPKPAKKNTSLLDFLKNAFRMRTVEGNTITYHKHIFGFVRESAPYALGILVILSLVLAWSLKMKDPIPGWLGAFLMTAVAILFGVIGYQYLDWKNDIYQVNAEEIIDISRKPLGSEDRKAAPLENILSTEYERNGLIGMLLNFGTVYIKIGDADFDFEDVSDPPSVQQDIISRQQGRNKKKKDAEILADQERMTDWLAMYHRTIEDLNNEKNQTDLPDSE